LVRNFKLPRRNERGETFRVVVSEVKNRIRYLPTKEKPQETRPLKKNVPEGVVGHQHAPVKAQRNERLDRHESRGKAITKFRKAGKGKTVGRVIDTNTWAT